MPDLDIAELHENPSLIAANINTPNALSLIFRPLISSDAAILGQYFLSLSENTRKLYGPHDFDQLTADRFCREIDYTQTIRMIAVHPKLGVIGYFILDLAVREHQLQRYAGYGLTLDPGDCCQIAPSVSDRWQNQGIGSPLMLHILHISRRMGYKSVLLTEGVYAHNTRAVHYYQKMGFQQVGTFYPSWGEGRPCHDMARDLSR